MSHTRQQVNASGTSSLVHETNWSPIVVALQPASMLPTAIETEALPDENVATQFVAPPESEDPKLSSSRQTGV